MYKVVLLKDGVIKATLRERFQTYEEARKVAIEKTRRLTDRPEGVMFAPMKEK
jgi:alanine-alpha-ketoisovalerate/valine-pyruvate aminotransferase